MLSILVAIAIIAIAYLLLIRPFQYWTNKGVQQGSPVPIFGDNWGIFARKQSFAEMVEMVYNIGKGARYSGTYQFFLPTLVIKDPDLIKQITVKDFDHFLDHRTFIPEESEPLWTKNLFALKGQKWRDMRSTLSPAFTSSKMKFMYSLMIKNAEQFVKYFLSQEKDSITLEMKDSFTRFANDVIASSAFGVECDSLRERNNEFYSMGKLATDFSGIWKIMKFFGYQLVPKLYDYFKVTLFLAEVSEFFKRLVLHNIDSRVKTGIVRPDLIHLLMEARKSGLKHDEGEAEVNSGFAVVEESEVGTQVKGKPTITDEDIAAQALVFFFAGFDSVSALMCFISYELGVNPDIQQKLIKEVDDTLKTCDGKITYEALLGMKYMDMVVSETIRKWPPIVAVDRVCTKPYTIQPVNPDEKPVHLEKDAVLWIPVYGIHRDPEYYPDPERFDPERFSDENIGSLKPYTYLHFGAGPRNCIGSRFALLETKAIFFYILNNFEIVPNQKTQIPLKINKKTLNVLNAENGFWFDLKRRVKL